MRCYHQRHKGTKGRTYRTGHDHNDKWEYPWNNIPLWLTTCGSCLLVDRLVGWLTTAHTFYFLAHKIHTRAPHHHHHHQPCKAQTSICNLHLCCMLRKVLWPLLLPHRQTDIGATAKEQQQQPLWSSLFYLWFLVDQIAGHTQQAMNTTTTT